MTKETMIMFNKNDGTMRCEVCGIVTSPVLGKNGRMPKGYKICPRGCGDLVAEEVVKKIGEARRVKIPDFNKDVEDFEIEIKDPKKLREAVWKLNNFKWVNNVMPVRENVIKPCLCLHFCPYGCMIEMFPLRKERTYMACSEFGHDCPVYYHAEGVFESTELTDDDMKKCWDEIYKGIK
jgi:hypothetical protein